jgi:hypothetical protein
MPSTSAGQQRRLISVPRRASRDRSPMHMLHAFPHLDCMSFESSERGHSTGILNTGNIGTIRTWVLEYFHHLQHVEVTFLYNKIHINYSCLGYRFNQEYRRFSFYLDGQYFLIIRLRRT